MRWPIYLRVENHEKHDVQGTAMKVSDVSRTIVCVVAHPDDEALGVGGTLIRHAQAGDRVEIIVLSDGEGSKTDPADRDPGRTGKAALWAKRAGCTLRRVLDFPDQRFDTVPMVDIVALLQKELSAMNIDVIYTHHPGDLNHDHRIACQATLVTVRPMHAAGRAPTVYAFETPSSTDQAPNVEPFSFQPNHYVILGDGLDAKMAALEVYENELGTPPHPRARESIRALARKRGAECGAEAAEAFVLLRSVWNMDAL
jgi:LmbE family N-acetylglucosaminyl deacetylase